MRLLLIRHGESSCNLLKQVTGRADSPLSDHGRQQCNMLASVLGNMALVPRKLYVSSMVRAIDTAKILFPNIDSCITPSLNEVDAGNVSEWSRNDFDQTYNDFWCPFDPSRNFPGGESHQCLQQRVVASFKEILDLHVGSESLVAIVAHAGTISSIFHWLYDIPMKYFSRFVVSNASVTMLEWDEPAQLIPHLRFFNYHPLDWQ